MLERLVRKELLTIDPTRVPGTGQYGFLQALVQRVAYETLARRERGRCIGPPPRTSSEDAGIDPDEIAEVIAAHHRDADRADPDGRGRGEMFEHARGRGSQGRRAGGGARRARGRAARLRRSRRARG